MKRVILTLLFILLLPMAMVWADQGVEGYTYTVSGADTTIAPGATVQLRKGLWQTQVTSDVNGYYIVSTPYTGKHEVRAYKWINLELWDSGWESVDVYQTVYAWSLCYMTNTED